MALKDKIITDYLSKPEQTKIAPVSPVLEVPAAKKADTGVIPTMKEYDPLSQGGGVYETLFKTLNKNIEPETPQQAAEREKRERTNANILALSDALSNVANVFFTSKGAAPQRPVSLSEVNRRRYEYAKAQRERNNDAWTRGVYNSRINDLQSEAAAKQAAYKAQQDKQKFELEQKEKDRNYLINVGKLKLEESKLLSDAELNKMKMEEQKRLNNARLANERARINLEKERIAQEKDQNGNTYKVVRFGLSDGSNVAVPADLKDDYYADVYNKLVEESQKQGKYQSVKTLLESSAGIGVPTSYARRDVIHTLAKEFPEVEQYMKERARQYSDYYTSPPAVKAQPTPGSPNTATIPGITNRSKPKAQTASSNNVQIPGVEEIKNSSFGQELNPEDKWSDYLE
jgi:hypothetical protein